MIQFTKEDLLKMEIGMHSPIVVEGEPVTKEQAEEIVFRTCSWDCREAILPEHDNHKVSLALEALDLWQMENNLMTSANSGGHGWCDWNGNIGTQGSYFTTDKYPSLLRVFEECQIIARAFPFLKLKAQIFDRVGNGIQTDVSGDPVLAVVQFDISDGKATARTPEHPEMKINFGYFDRKKALPAPKLKSILRRVAARLIERTTDEEKLETLYSLL